MVKVKDFAALKRLQAERSARHAAQTRARAARKREERTRERGRYEEAIRIKREEATGE